MFIQVNISLLVFIYLIALGYKKRCSIHICASENVDPVWLIDTACFLALMNFHIEFINITITHCRIIKALKIKMALGKQMNSMI
jgi:hypothetical protein